MPALKLVPATSNIVDFNLRRMERSEAEIAARRAVMERRRRSAQIERHAEFLQRDAFPGWTEGKSWWS